MSMIDVLDLPQLYTKPSAQSLLDTLALLTYTPRSWDANHTDLNKEGSHHGSSPDPPVSVNPEGVARYLTSIVSNSLQWITDDDAREEIWNQASLRLSERSGRTAMGSMSRKFRIPTADSSFELSIHEPALTGDDLGLKTWAASYLLAKRLRTFNLVQPGNDKPNVLELGSGTGLVGLAMAALGANVVLTDLPSIAPNLARNAQDNSEIVNHNGGSTRTGVLDWNNPASCQLVCDNDVDEALTRKFPFILAADSLYSSEHPRMLVGAVQQWLSEDIEAKVIVEFPYREAYLPEIKDFRERMSQAGLFILDEGEEKGYDDWGGSAAGEEENEDALVTCWWACWGRQA
ncbi:unnamed protein product [Periconia digitata]|uniref:Uncharacterized protein n=1 Tax=Periconia digitata TaxID=1303443 RepID=A0A9W4XST4_9PLEO|nr:unnamed protein product [Periconia digitata]